MEARIGIGNSLLRDFIRHRGALSSARPLAGAALNGRLAALFVDNEILAMRRDHATLDFLVRHCGGELIEAPPLPPRPAQLEGKSLRDITHMPEWVRVRIGGDDIPHDALHRLVTHDGGIGLDFSSNSAAGTLAASLLLRERGLRGRLNHAGTPHGFPFWGSDEGGDDGNAYTWPEYGGTSRIARAWQLSAALDRVRAMRNPVFIGILDTGFSDAVTDYATGPHFNLANEGASAIGPAPFGYRWHGTAVAGIAAARVDNSKGAAGAGGIGVGPAAQALAMPFLFRTDITDEQIIRCLQCCVWWGIDVLNMSVGLTANGLFSSVDSDWEETFQWASDQGLVMVASAGNNGAELPGLRIYPATRSPGVITVGALDASGSASRADSNYGSSVDIWAPGTAIHTVPDPDSGGKRGTLDRTSAAAPLVAGVAALMMSANPALRPDDIMHILRETAWTGSPDPRSNRILDAYAALLRAIHDTLPPGTFEEPNDTPATARQMTAVAPNAYAPLGETVIGNPQDVDYHRFTIGEYGEVLIQMETVEGLAPIHMELIPEFEVGTLDEFRQYVAPHVQTIYFSATPPGNYLVKVSGNGPNYYRLRVDIAPGALPPDLFERNDTRDSATHVVLRKRQKSDRLGLVYPGAYSATIPSPADADWFRITDIGEHALTFPCCQIRESDAPLDIRLYQLDGSLMGTFSQVRRIDIALPAPACLVEIRCARATRYAIGFLYQLDQSQLPEPQQVPGLGEIPEWWPDPPFELRGWEQWLEVIIDDGLSRHGMLQVESDKPVEWDLLSPERSLVRSGTAAGDVGGQLDVQGLAPGRYLLRVGRQARAASRFQPADRAAIKFSIGPGF